MKTFLIVLGVYLTILYTAVPTWIYITRPTPKPKETE
jgi:hypothetical protein